MAALNVVCNQSSIIKVVQSSTKGGDQVTDYQTFGSRGPFESARGDCLEIMGNARSFLDRPAKTAKRTEFWAEGPKKGGKTEEKKEERNEEKKEEKKEGVKDTKEVDFHHSPIASSTFIASATDNWLQCSIIACLHGEQPGPTTTQVVCMLLSLDWFQVST
jgi:hypothetical protein